MIASWNHALHEHMEIAKLNIGTAGGPNPGVITKAIIRWAPTSRASIPNKCREIATVLNARVTLANFVESAVMGENRGGG